LNAAVEIAHSSLSD